MSEAMRAQGDLLERDRLRRFGLAAGGLFLVIGVWPAIFRAAGPRLWALVVAAALVLPALVHPRFLAGAYRAWMGLGRVLNWVNTRVILSVFFYGLLTPLGVVMRLVRTDPMRRKTDPAAPSYRLERHPRSDDHLRHQF